VLLDERHTIEETVLNRTFENQTYWLIVTAAFGLLVTDWANAGVVDFEDLTPSRPYTKPDGSEGGKYWYGSDRTGGFVSGGVTFKNSYSYDEDYKIESWSGWSYSNTSDVTTAGFTNQFSAYTGVDHTTDPGTNYAVYGLPWPLTPTLTLAPNTTAKSVWLTNTTYAALSMLNGDSFARKFGDSDWFKLTILGDNGSSVEFYLADYRFSDNSQNYIVDKWTQVDLRGLGDARTLTFELSSSDEGEYGMNTPAYFAMDDLEFSAVPEPGTLAMFSVGALLGAAFLRRRRRVRAASCR
jgi:hypothetical protein